MEERNKWLQVRMSQDERSILDEIARSYDMDTSSFVRFILRFFAEHRPALVIASSLSDATGPNAELIAVN